VIARPLSDVNMPATLTALSGSRQAAQLESLIESFIELMSQVFMLPIFHRRTSC
jgi:hypothetical protein